MDSDATLTSTHKGGKTYSMNDDWLIACRVPLSHSLQYGLNGRWVAGIGLARCSKISLSGVNFNGECYTHTRQHNVGLGCEVFQQCQIFQRAQDGRYAECLQFPRFFHGACKDGDVEGVCIRMGKQPR